MAPQMISPGFVEDALECLHRQRIPAEPVLRAAGPRCGARTRHAAAVRTAVARDRQRNRRRILRACGSTDAARQLHVAVSRRAGCRHAGEGATARAAVSARGTRRAARRARRRRRSGADRPHASRHALFCVRLPDVLADTARGGVLADRAADSAATHRFCMPEPGPAQRLPSILRCTGAFRSPRQQACVQCRVSVVADDPLRTIAEDISARRTGELAGPLPAR